MPSTSPILGVGAYLRFEGRQIRCAFSQLGELQTGQQATGRLAGLLFSRQLLQHGSRFGAAIQFAAAFRQHYLHINAVWRFLERLAQ